MLDKLWQDQTFYVGFKLPGTVFLIFQLFENLIQSRMEVLCRPLYFILGYFVNKGLYKN